MPSSHLILCLPLLLLPPIPPSIRVFSNESILHMRWPKYIILKQHPHVFQSTQNFFSALFFVFWGFREVVRVGEVSILAPLYTIPLSGGKLASSSMPVAWSAWLSILTCPNPLAKNSLYVLINIWQCPLKGATACVRDKSLQSCLTLCDRMDRSPPGSSVHGILQARILEWVAISSSRGSSPARDWIRVFYVSCIGRQVLYHWLAPWKEPQKQRVNRKQVFSPRKLNWIQLRLT